MTEDFLEWMADFYGSSTLDELATLFGVEPVEVLDYLYDLIEDNYDDICVDMGYNNGGNNEEED